MVVVVRQEEVSYTNMNRHIGTLTVVKGGDLLVEILPSLTQVKKSWAQRRLRGMYHT